MAYDTDVENLFYVEGGLGVFSVLNQDWTLNVEAVFGNYGWHNQASVKAMLGWQPNDWFAIDLYAKSSIYDSADGKDLNTYMYNAATDTNFVYYGDSKIDKMSEMSVGAQVIFHF